MLDALGESMHDRRHAAVFTKIAVVIAWLGFAVGGIMIALGALTLASPHENDQAIGLTVLTLGGPLVIGSIILGVLTEIAKSVSNSNGSKTTHATNLMRAPPPADPAERLKWANREPPYDED
jgi:hypothetical protein